MRTRMAVLLAFLLVVAGFFLGQARGRTVARPQATAPGGCTVPKAWGTFKGNFVTGIAFEDSSGTVRIIDALDCKNRKTNVELEINRQ